jgi:hypothetical protein
MLKKYSLILAMAIALLITGCKQSSGIAYTPPPITEEWTVSMTQSGGIMGLQRSITVTSDGKYTVTDERAGNTVKNKLTEAQTTELQDLVTSLEFTAPKKPAICADCFVYDVEIQSNGQKMIVQADDIALPDSGIAPLVDFLRGIMDAALK